MKTLNNSPFSPAKRWGALCLHLAFALLPAVFAGSLQAQLECSAIGSKHVGNKAVVMLGLTNNYPDTIESARATVFLVDNAGKVVGQGTRWVIGGTPEKPGLESKKGTVFHFVIETDKAYVTNRTFVNRIVLAGGRVVSPIAFSGKPDVQR
jgi:hypothetical protein